MTQEVAESETLTKPHSSPGFNTSLPPSAAVPPSAADPPFDAGCLPAPLLLGWGCIERRFVFDALGWRAAVEEPAWDMMGIRWPIQRMCCGVSQMRNVLVCMMGGDARVVEPEVDVSRFPEGFTFFVSSSLYFHVSLELSYLIHCGQGWKEDGGKTAPPRTSVDSTRGGGRRRDVPLSTAELAPLPPDIVSTAPSEARYPGSR